MMRQPCSLHPAAATYSVSKQPFLREKKTPLHTHVYLGGLAPLRLQGHPGHPHPHGDQQPPDERWAQWPQQLDPQAGQRPEEWFRWLHVPDQHGAHDQPGKRFSCFKKRLKLFKAPPKKTPRNVTLRANPAAVSFPSNFIRCRCESMQGMPMRAGRKNTASSWRCSRVLTREKSCFLVNFEILHMPSYSLLFHILTDAPLSVPCIVWR